MSIDLNDPRLTAYALDELDDAERREVEALLAGSAEAMKAVEEIRAAAQWMERELKAEPVGMLTETQRKSVESAMRARRMSRWVPIAMAACLLFAVSVSGIVYMRSQRVYSAREIPSNALVDLRSDPKMLNTLKQLGYVDQVGLRKDRRLLNDTVDVNGDGSVDATRPMGEQVALAPKEKKELEALGYVSGDQIEPASPVEKGARTSGAVKPEEVNSWSVVKENNSTPKQFLAPSTSEPKGTAFSLADTGNQSPNYDSIAKEVNGSPTSASPPVVTPPTLSKKGTDLFRFEYKDGKYYRLQNADEVARPADTNRSGDKVWYSLEGGSQAEPRGTVDRDEFTRKFIALNNLNPEEARQLLERLEKDPNYFSNARRSAQEFLAEPNTESYNQINDNPFTIVTQSPLLTFSIDVDTAAYANMRRFITTGQLPPPDAVRIEEMINYFSYDYPQPTGDDPFSVNVEVAGCPWDATHQLIRVGFKGRTFADEVRPACNLVFLVDVSGSMEPENKLPLLKKAMGMLTSQLRPQDRVAIVVYAGASGLVLPSTTCNNQPTITHALDNLKAGGSTNGGAGIELAYQQATENFITGGVNRVILATDGDFNVGITDQNALVNLIEQKAKTGVFLSVLGFGMGNLKDSTLEKLADKGNGNYAYIDTMNEAKKVLVDQIGGTLVTIAKDVKIQVEFNPAKVQAYRLIGYENRLLASKDFNDDKKDAGEIGAGHTVTALYELIPPGVNMAGVDPLKYQTQPEPEKTTVAVAMPHGNELMTVKLRYKQPDGVTSKLIERPVVSGAEGYAAASTDFRFAASVASFGMLLRHSPHAGNANFDTVLEMATGSVGADLNRYRAEFVELVKRAKYTSGALNR